MRKSTFLQSLPIMALATSCLMPLANAQTGPANGTGGMNPDMKKPMPMMTDKGMGSNTDNAMGAGMDMKPMMMDMQNKMSAMKSSGNMDVDFAMMMRLHHQSAITMAEAQLKNGKDAQMRKMAKDIIYAQKKEIAVFDKFLAGRGNAEMKMSEPGTKMKK